MNRYSLTHLTPEVARRRLDQVDREEKGRLADGLALIALIDKRRDYRAAGYSSMLRYCRGRLKMSEDRAAKRLQVARVARRLPQVFDAIADGRLCVSGAVALAPHLEARTVDELLAASAYLSRDEIVRMLFARSRRADGAAVVCSGETTSGIGQDPAVPGQAGSLADLCATAGADTSVLQHAPILQHAPGHVGMTRRGQITPCASGHYDVRLSITKAEHEDLRKAQALLGHAVPSGDPALVYARAIKHYVAHLEKQHLGVKPGAAPNVEPKGRGIPKPLRRLVWERDGGRCTFVSPDGHRCEETGRLEIDHIQPVAMGGSTTPDNLRVLCRTHNQYEAERVLGKEHVECRRELAQRERARARVAAEASVARAKARDAAKQARYDDLHAALRGLGFRDAEARRGAGMAEAMPDASLEDCLKRALTELSRPIALRGERMARSTA